MPFPNHSGSFALYLEDEKRGICVIFVLFPKENSIGQKVTEFRYPMIFWAKMMLLQKQSNKSNNACRVILYRIWVKITFFAYEKIVFEDKKDFASLWQRTFVKKTCFFERTY